MAKKCEYLGRVDNASDNGGALFWLSLTGWLSEALGLLGLFNVSGRQRMIRRSKLPPKMARNHKVLRQPRCCANNPPMIGASPGPQSGPR